MKQTGENIFEKFTNDILSERETSQILGGRGKKKSRDRDIFDIDDDDQ